MLVVIAIISLWTPLAHSAIADRWFSLPNLWFLMPVPLLVALISLWLWRSLGSAKQPYAAFCIDAGADFSRVQRAGDQYLAPHHSTVHYAVAGGSSGAESGLYVGWRAADTPDNPGVHLLELLRFPRQSSTWRGVSSMQQTIWKRLMWLVIL